MWFVLLLFCIFTPTLISGEGAPFSKGQTCNLEIFKTLSRLVISRFFCVPESDCTMGVHRYKVLPDDVCSYYADPPSGGKAVCCHEADIRYINTSFWDNPTYVPGVRAALMCKDYVHFTCGPDNSDYCTEDVTNEPTVQGLLTNITVYPHTALIGHEVAGLGSKINWFCQGSVIAKDFILTALPCSDLYYHRRSSHVKVGMSEICLSDDCGESEHEQILAIIGKRETYGYMGLINVSPDIKFNRFVRPACLPTKFNVREATGWFPHFAKPQKRIETSHNKRPVFDYVHTNLNVELTAKTEGYTSTYVLLSRTGLPYKKEQQIEAWFDNGTFSTYKDLWIRTRGNHVSVWLEKPENTVTQCLVPDTATPGYNVIGLRTPQGKGDFFFGGWVGRRLRKPREWML